jgi:hypothetical protein
MRYVKEEDSYYYKTRRYQPFRKEAVLLKKLYMELFMMKKIEGIQQYLGDHF